MYELYLIGAGASAFCGPTRPTAPPLGDALFDALLPYPAWQALPEHAQQVFRERGFERGMANVRSTHQLSGRASSLVRDMASFFLTFGIEDGNEYLRFVASLKKRATAAAVATLNYDMLLEEAFTRVSGGYSSHMGAESGEFVQILKVHGSPNVFPCVPRGLVLHDEGSNDRLWEGPVSFLNKGDALGRLREVVGMNNDAIAPVMALYSPDKEVLHSGGYVARVHSLYAELALQADTIFVIGVKKVPDAHVWDPIARAPGRIVYVNPSVEDNATFAMWADACGVRYDLSRQGFSQFLDDHCSNEG